MVEFAKSVKREAQLLLPDSNSMIRLDELGVWDHLIQSAKQKGADIRVLCYMSDSNENVDGIVRRISSQAPSIRIFRTASSEAVLFIVDNEKFLRVEEKGTGVHIPTPPSTSVSDAISLAIWSNSKKGTASFKSIFDILWKQTDLYQQLKVHDKMQKEFINVAAHELRTPIQPIIGLGEVLRSKNKLSAEEYEEYLDVIIRNARRLQQLADDILDVTKIESQSLKLKKERFDLQELITAAINEYIGIIKKSNKNINLAYVSKDEKDNKSIFIHADRGRISQVVSNLLSNALKFTEEGSIIVTTAISDDNNKNAIIVSVKDSGAGIDCEILPQLFTKFASKSFQGTGLGLFISKSIVEAHAGRIWAKNNPDGKGATFTLALPLSTAH
jgi:signal transduction histidine kinase